MDQQILTIATRNQHKTREIQEILGPEFTIHDIAGRQDIADVAETGKTFEENAILKAVALSKHVSGLVLADDSGLEVDSLHGAPGVFSARYAGAARGDRENVAKLLRELNAVDQSERRARFVCVLAVARHGALLKTFSGEIEGGIAGSPRGNGGFGYDPIFIPKGLTETFGELPAETKNRLSHRARAIEAAVPFLRTAL
ncbi:MAG TPA: RdgB/HAM1 family non-canonical purine NTP pyrophosphatase [Chthoniobacterales bacterium]